MHPVFTPVDLNVSDVKHVWTTFVSSIKTANYIIFTFVTVMKSGPNITP